MRVQQFILGLLLFATIIACGDGKNVRVPVYTEVDDDEEEEVEQDIKTGDEVVVPFRSENGVKYVQVKLNGVGLEMVFDTGCSGMHISVAEAQYLYSKGTLTEEDFLGVSPTQTADGSVNVNMVVNLREVIINDQIRCPDVTATVSDNTNAPLLLGNDVLDRLATITIDNVNSNLIFTFK
ncbi:MAG: retroviral-like aspartic protease family protein [Prevotellaceae bacterium]|nr:retroviral-like aspartic protease family protein [Prevotellaceae bacterium]